MSRPHKDQNPPLKQTFGGKRDDIVERLEADIEAHEEQWSLGMSEARISADVERAALTEILEYRRRFGKLGRSVH